MPWEKTMQKEIQQQPSGSNFSGELLREIIDYLPIPIFVKDEASAFVLSNRRHCELAGLSEQQLLGQTTAIFHGEEKAKASRARDLPVLDSGEETAIQRNYTYPNDKVVYVETRKARLIDEEGKRYVLGVNFDLTEVRRRELHLNAMTQSLLVGIIEIQEEVGVIFASRRAFEILGVDTTAMPVELVQEKLKETENFDAGIHGQCELRLQVNDNGQLRHILIDSSGWCDIPYREQKSAFVTLTDVTEFSELKQQHSEIEKLNSELAQSLAKLRISQDELVKKGKLEQLGQLTATIAHELRNPLGSVRTSTFLLERKLGEESSNFRTQLDRIANGVTRCDDIITQLLDFARSKALSLKRSAFDPWLIKLVEEIADGFPSSVKFTCELGLRDLPVAFDEERMRRAIINTIQNAVEAMMTKEGQLSAGVKCAEIQIRARTQRESVVVEIRDSGPGIPPDVLSRIREPLFTTKNFGTGLGVPAVERILEQHGGTLKIVTEVGVGTCITLQWPMDSPEGAPVLENLIALP
jgi:PAS domain S-box-containing protein